jgi:hypothetical protein
MFAAINLSLLRTNVEDPLSAETTATIGGFGGLNTACAVRQGVRSRPRQGTEPALLRSSSGDCCTNR